MSTPVISMALAVMCALFSAAAADTAHVLAHRNHAADEARRVAVQTLDACALGGAKHCKPPAACTAPQCRICWREGAVRADVSIDWSPVLLRALTPAQGRHALSLGAIDLSHLAGPHNPALPACASRKV